MSALHNFLFIAVPYMAVAVFLVGVVYRYRVAPFTVSSLSSQFLETKDLFWGSVPFHVGMIVILILHLAAFLFPQTLLAWNSYPVRLLILEITGFAFGLSFLFGSMALLIRRVTNPRIRAVTTWMDVAVELLLFFQILFGCMIAVGYRWGSSWFASDLSPYLWSLVKLDPHTDALKAMPLMVQAHVVGAFLVVLILPFTRLMHLLVAPFHYLLRPFQLVIWNWDRKAMNDPGSPWNKHKPRNT
ncbi:MAG: respiratory nitrate reductase subunit gamma [Omnitrophica bacterium RIFCSPLOWO2_12_FULL_44_17]|uniref:Respiratory nitrate reductase subunit gamma n=1 Tax=Candidatus Danuiimicrobium aquiferis TaxID=1801832 RepID=A0A1G1KTD2_9BACT|nr:MAG: respiratory nitrate reductase subunit gamma [Omnitrophica bacterium RIFCSPHIGHO2_02_FULL_45_28]OGW96032.1 MAG: respiratory nitrate reductase subunit gamma [Omnitrophica bacterium RIFCSPLOWO2_12_FULL_44_17]